MLLFGIMKLGITADLQICQVELDLDPKRYW